MKTIEVSDEMYEFLMNLSKELNTQDHRGTRMPYFFQVQTQEQVAVPEYQGTQAWHCDGSLIESDEEIEDVIMEYKGWNKHTTEFNKLEDYEIESVLKEMGYDKVYYDYKDNLENAFLTSKACDEHIARNKHNYNSPVNYLSHAYRNPELEKVMEFLCELTGGKLHL